MLYIRVDDVIIRSGETERTNSQIDNTNLTFMETKIRLILICRIFRLQMRHRGEQHLCIKVQVPIIISVFSFCGVQSRELQGAFQVLGPIRVHILNLAFCWGRGISLCLLLSVSCVHIAIMRLIIFIGSHMEGNKLMEPPHNHKGINTLTFHHQHNTPPQTGSNHRH